MAALDLIMARVADFRRRKPLRAVPLIVTVFGDAVAPHGARVWLGSLMRLLAPLGVSERLARTSVYRLAQEHWLRAETAGRKSDYLLTDFGRRQFEQATRHIYSITRPSWDGRWRMVVALPGAWNAGEREHLRRSLAWQGFGKLDSGVYLHPGASLDEALAALDTEDFPGLRAKLLALEGEHRLVAELGGRPGRVPQHALPEGEHGGLLALARVHPRAGGALGADRQLCDFDYDFDQCGDEESDLSRSRP